MALANHHVRSFDSIWDLQQFIQTDAGITGVVFVTEGNSGKLILVYTTA